MKKSTVCGFLGMLVVSCAFAATSYASPLLEQGVAKRAVVERPETIPSVSVAIGTHAAPAKGRAVATVPVRKTRDPLADKSRICQVEALHQGGPGGVLYCHF